MVSIHRFIALSLIMFPLNKSNMSAKSETVKSTLVKYLTTSKNP